MAGSGKPLFEAAFANVSLASPAKVDTKNAARGPLLLIAGGRDHTAPASVTRATRPPLPEVRRQSPNSASFRTVGTA